MKDFFGSKTTILVLGCLSILIIIFLIASINTLELNPPHLLEFLMEK